MATENKLQLDPEQVAEIAAMIMKSAQRDEKNVEELKEDPKAYVAKVTNLSEEKEVTNLDLTAILTTLGGMLMSTAGKSAKVDLSDGLGFDDMIGFLTATTKTSDKTTINDPLSAVVGGLLGNSPEAKSGQGSTSIGEFAGVALKGIFQAATNAQNSNSGGDMLTNLAGAVLSAALKTK